MTRVTLVHRYYAPDSPPYAQMLPLIGRALVDAGMQVEVLTCQPSYRPNLTEPAPSREEPHPGLTVRRFAVMHDRTSRLRKAANVVTFSSRVAWSLVSRRRERRPDVVMVASTPPVVPARVVSWAASMIGSRVVYHKQDIYPDVATSAGLMRDGVLARVLRAVDAGTERRVDRVVVLSDDMRDCEVGRGVQPDRVAIINNFDPWQLDTVDPGSRTATDGRPVRVVFAGNLGRFQNLERVMEAMRHLRDRADIELHVFGDGALADTLHRYVEENGCANVHLHGFQPPDLVADFLRRRADVGLVSLMPGTIRAAYPSKSMSYLRNGCPVLAMVEGSSQLARQLAEYGAGVQVDPGDARALSESVVALSRDRPWLAGARDRARRMYEAEFSPDRQTGSWTRLFEDLAGQAPRLAGRVPTGDRVLAALGMVVTAPVVAAGALAVRSGSPGPALHTQARVGADGQPFTIVKLRTMHVSGGASRQEPQGRITSAADDRVVPVARLLRRLKIDELPQLWNVVRGDMALVGPRPEDPGIVEDHYAGYMLRSLSVPPGLTSPGTLDYYRREHLIPDDPRAAEDYYARELLPYKLGLDMAYLERRTRAYDCSLLLRTLAGLVGREGPGADARARERARARELVAGLDRWPGSSPSLPRPSGTGPALTGTG